VKMEELTQKMEEENRALRDEHNATINDNLSNVLEKISNELKLRDERIESSMRNIGKESRDQLVQCFEAALARSTQSIQASLEMSQARNVEIIRQTIGQMLVPAIDSVCSQLFHQLNETFANGLQDFMSQLRTIQMEHQQMVASAAPPSQTPQMAYNDYSTLNQLIEANQFAQAFELALSRQDLSALNFICHKVDPDVLFSSPNSSPLPTVILLALLQQLSQKLESETQLKFHWIETCLISLNDGNPQAHPQSEKYFRQTLEQLAQAITLFSAQDTSSAFKRQTRIINQLVVNLLR